MSGERKKVLVVEDNRAMAKVLAFNLQRAGFDADVALNPRIAFELLSGKKYDFITTDCQMPEMSGEEFVRCLRADERYADMPVLMCSAKGYEFDVEGLLKELNIIKFLFKPFSPREIVDIVRATLEPAGTPSLV